MVNVVTATGEGTFSTWSVVNNDTTPFWEFVESTNQHKMFDQYVNSETIKSDSIEVSLASTRADTVALFGVYATSVVVEFWDATETELFYSETILPAYGADVVANISDWYEYFFGESTALTEMVIQSDLAVYSGVVKVELDQATGVNARCSNMVFGRGIEIGDTRYGSSIGIVDYSRKETDEDGVISITEGYWAKEHSYSLIMKTSKTKAIYDTLASLRATPTAWIAADGQDYDLFITYALLSDFTITVPGPNVSVGNLELLGLI